MKCFKIAVSQAMPYSYNFKNEDDKKTRKSTCEAIEVPATDASIKDFAKYIDWKLTTYGEYDGDKNKPVIIGYALDNSIPNSVSFIYGGDTCNSHVVFKKISNLDKKYLNRVRFVLDPCKSYR